MSKIYKFWILLIAENCWKYIILIVKLCSNDTRGFHINNRWRHFFLKIGFKDNSKSRRRVLGAFSRKKSLEIPDYKLIAPYHYWPALYLLPRVFWIVQFVLVDYHIFEQPGYYQLLLSLIFPGEQDDFSVDDDPYLNKIFHSSSL